MGNGIALLIESLVAVLLATTIGYCFLLNKRLMKLRADEGVMKATIAELVTATDIAGRAISGLKQAVQDCEAALTDRLDARGEAVSRSFRTDACRRRGRAAHRDDRLGGQAGEPAAAGAGQHPGQPRHRDPRRRAGLRPAQPGTPVGGRRLR